MIDGRIATLTKERTILNVKKKRQKPLYDALQLNAMYADRDTEAFPLTVEEQEKLKKAHEILQNHSIDILNTERNTLYADLVRQNCDLRALKIEQNLCKRILTERTQIERKLKPYLTEDRELRKETLEYER